MTIRFGCSYIGNRHIEHFQKDLEEMKDYVDYIVLTTDEWDIKYCKKTIKNFVHLAKDYGIDVYLDCWGAWGVTGGESISEFKRPKSLLDSKFIKYMKDWIRLAYTCEAKGVFFDEMKGKDLPECLDILTRYARDNFSLETIVCLLPRNIEWNKIFSSYTVSIISTDPYFIWEPIVFPAFYFNYMLRRLLIHGKRYGHPTQLWFQGFRLKKEHTQNILEAMDKAYKYGIRDFAVWSYKGNEAMDLSVEDPSYYWNAIKTKIKELKDIK